MINLGKTFKIETKFNNSIETFNLKGVKSGEFESIESLQYNSGGTDGNTAFLCLIF